MKLQMIGCSYQQLGVEQREQLAFTPQQVPQALALLRKAFPHAEAVLLSTCNRVEIYLAVPYVESFPPKGEVAQLVADFHQLPASLVTRQLIEKTGADAVRHLFTVAVSLDSMVLGEPQILSQVKQAYELANLAGSTGPLTHAAFQSAVRVARRVMSETTLHQRRVSIPSVAVADFARQIFERFDDKQILVIGAGEMAEETLRYLVDEGANRVTIINRSEARAQELAREWQGRAVAWDGLHESLAVADLVISTTGASEPVVTLDDYRRIEPLREQRPLFILDLAVPRDFAPAIGNCLGVYLYAVDDLQAACAANRLAREKELPAAHTIIEQETQRFMKDLHHRSSAPVIQQLRREWHEPKEEELRRLFNKLPGVDEAGRQEIRMAFDRLVNKLLHPPLESLRAESEQGSIHSLLDALKRLFQLRD